ncbi:MAG: hypothetical protein JST19_17530 [Bacteroidetes bacterium]|nr:hypothetical protein [Bacteroidota bacterium]
MRIKNLVNVACTIALCFFFLPALCQNTSNKTADTTNKKTPHYPDAASVIITVPADRQFNQGAIFNPVDQLAGKMPGVTVTEPGGDPNQTAAVRVRGQSSLYGNMSPLFIVDGVILNDASEFQNMPPDEIVSYTVLKNASETAVYGLRGANGVIIVTTKKGEKGHPVLSYNGLVGAATQSKYYDLLNASEYKNAIGSNAGFYDKGANTDWQKAIGRTAIQQKNSLTLSVGSKAITYLGGIDYQDQPGIIMNNGKKQLGLRFNTELKALADKLDIKAGIQNVNTTRNYTDYSIFSFVPNAPPTYPVKNTDGSYYAFSDFNEANPAERLSGEVLGDKEYLNLINGSADYSILDDLKFGVSGSADLNNIQSNGYIPSFPLEGNQSQSTSSTEDTHWYNVNVHLNYDKTFGKSTVNLLGAYEYNDHSDSFTYSNGYSKEAYILKSVIVRAAYSYADRFYATASLREDNSPLFQPDKHGYFPALSLAYEFKNTLFNDVDWISAIKLQAGYGVTGNSTYPSGYLMTQWEKTQGTNVGLDFSLFNGSLSGNIDYFNNQQKNLIAPFTLPSPPFFSGTVLTNGAAMVNKGLELALSGHIISGHKLSWNAYGEIAFITTTVTSLSTQYVSNGQSYTANASQVPLGYAEGRGLSSNPIEFLKTGYSPYVFYLPHYTGVNAQGDQTFDGQTIPQNPDPKGYYMDPSPKFNYGITNNFDYGNWNLSFTSRGVYGQKVFNNTLLNIETITRLPGNNVTRDALTNGIKDAPVASDLWLENASFFRMDNVILGYSFKNLSFASTLRVFVAANNLFVITPYKGLDPEVATWTGNPNNNVLFGANVNGSKTQAYIDGNYNGYAYYPVAKTFSLGVNVSLK